MSQLTREEKEFIAQWDDGTIMGFTIADGERLVDLVRRLSARCEELQETECSKCKGWGTIWIEPGIPNKVDFCSCKQGQINRLQSNLSDLLSAVEQGEDFWMGNGYFYGSTLQAPAGITLTKVKVIIAETLSTVADGIRK